MVKWEWPDSIDGRRGGINRSVSGQISMIHSGQKIPLSECCDEVTDTNVSTIEY